MLVKLSDVAEAAGVSLSTASRVINNSDHPVAEPTRRAVLLAAERLGYQPNLLARGLRTEHTLTIGIVVEDVASPFAPMILRGLQDYLDQRSYLSIIINADWDPKSELHAISVLVNRQVDGLVLLESYIQSVEDVPILADIPHVFALRLPDTPGPASVVPDDWLGGRLATEHLIALGHRRIALINGPTGWRSSGLRQAGYEAAMNEAGLRIDPSLILERDWTVEAGYLGVQELLSIDHPPTAVFGTADLIALGAIIGAWEIGLDVPEDLAVVGNDDREFAHLLRPGITTVRLPCREMGQAAAEMLMKLIDGEIEAPEPVCVPGELIMRQSCGGCKEPWAPDRERIRLPRASVPVPDSAGLGYAGFTS